MKKMLVLMLVTLGFGAKGQAVFTADYASQADVNVFVVDYESLRQTSRSLKCRMLPKPRETMASGFGFPTPHKPKKSSSLWTTRLKPTSRSFL